MEILAPINNLHTLKAAIHHGASAVYCSGPGFSARSNASISFEEISEIIEYAHLRSVRVFITVNTLILDSEFKQLIDMLDQLYLMNVDAFIIQDLGLFELLHSRYHKIDIHCSTQMHIDNGYAALYAKDNFASRIVTPREMSFEEIKKVKEMTGLEIETFIHGALCVSYSGQCLISSMIGQNSGNRGRCSQTCRFNFKVIDNDGNVISQTNLPLNLRDLNNIDLVNEYRANLIDSIKIEGRLKGATYIGAITKNYFNALNDYEVDYNEIKTVFNRQHTSGLISSGTSGELANRDRINNTGNLVGKVIECKANRLKIEINQPVYRLDSIRIVSNTAEDGLTIDKLFVENKEVDQASSGLISINTTKKFKVNSLVYVVASRRLEKAVDETINREPKKTMINLKVTFKENSPLIIQYNDLIVKSELVAQKALKTPLTQSDLVKQLTKTGNTPFKFNLSFDLFEQGLIIPIKEINTAKRLMIDLVCKDLLKHDRKIHQFIPEVKTSSQTNSFKVIYEIKTIDQAKGLIDPEIIYVDNLAILNDVAKIHPHAQIVPALSNVIQTDEFTLISKQIEDYEQVVVSELGMFNYLDKKLITNYTIPVVNKFACDKLLEKADFVTISPELNRTNILSMDLNKMEIIGYGRIKLMTYRYCLLNKNKRQKCGSCQMCQQNNYFLVDEMDHQYPLIYQENDLLTLYDYQPINLISKIKELKQAKLSRFRVAFSSESKEEVVEVVNMVNHYLEYGKKPKNSYLGQYNKKVF